MLPFTGRYSEVAASMRVAMELAVEDQGRSQRRLRLIFEDDYSHPDSTDKAVRRLVTNGAKALTGGYPSECSRVMAAVADELGVPYLICSASDDSLTINSSRWVFRLAPASTDYNDGLLGFMTTVVGAQRRIGVIYEDHPRTGAAFRDLCADFEARWKGEVVYEAFDPGLRDFKPTIQRMKAAQPTVVYILAAPIDAAALMIQAREMSWAPAAFLLGTAVTDEDRFSVAADGATAYCLAPVVWWHTMPHPGAGTFTRAFIGRWGRAPDYRDAEAYAAVQILSWVQDRGASDEDDLRSALDTADLLTVFGRVRFDMNGSRARQNRVRTGAVQLIDGRWQVVWPLELASVDAVYPMPDWNMRPEQKKKPLSSRWFPLMVVFITGLMLILTYIRRREVIRKLNE